MLGPARLNPVGGQVQRIGYPESLTVTVSAPQEYNVICSSLPTYRTPLLYCQRALDLLPYGNEPLTFGPAGHPGVKVSLPRRYTAGHCAIQIDWQPTNDVASWNDINNAIAAIFTKCLHETRELGLVTGLGNLGKIVVRVMEPGAGTQIETA